MTEISETLALQHAVDMTALLVWKGTVAVAVAEPKSIFFAGKGGRTDGQSFDEAFF